MAALSRFHFLWLLNWSKLCRREWFLLRGGCAPPTLSFFPPYQRCFRVLCLCIWVRDKPSSLPLVEWSRVHFASLRMTDHQHPCEQFICLFAFSLYFSAPVHCGCFQLFPIFDFCPFAQNYLPPSFSCLVFKNANVCFFPNKSIFHSAYCNKYKSICCLYNGK